MKLKYKLKLISDILFSKDNYNFADKTINSLVEIGMKLPESAHANREIDLWMIANDYSMNNAEDLNVVVLSRKVIAIKALLNLLSLPLYNKRRETLHKLISGASDFKLLTPLKLDNSEFDEWTDINDDISIRTNNRDNQVYQEMNKHTSKISTFTYNVIGNYYRGSVNRNGIIDLGYKNYDECSNSLEDINAVVSTSGHFYSIDCRQFIDDINKYSEGKTYPIIPSYDIVARSGRTLTIVRYNDLVDAIKQYVPWISINIEKQDDEDNFIKNLYYSHPFSDEEVKDFKYISHKYLKVPMMFSDDEEKVDEKKKPKENNKKKTTSRKKKATENLEKQN